MVRIVTKCCGDVICSGLSVAVAVEAAARNRISLAHADLRGMDLWSVDLIGADLSYADLTGTYLKRANLTGANLIGAIVTDANFRDANLTNVNYTDCDLFSADIRGAITTGASAVVRYGSARHAEIEEENEARMLADHLREVADMTAERAAYREGVL